MTSSEAGIANRSPRWHSDFRTPHRRRPWWSKVPRSITLVCMFAWQFQVSTPSLAHGLHSRALSGLAIEEQGGAKEAGGATITQEIDAGKLKELGLAGRVDYPCMPELVHVLAQEGADGLWAASFLARNKCKSLAGSVVHLVEHKSGAVRRTVAELLGHLGGLEAENGVKRLLVDRDETVRAAAVRAICEIAPDRCGSEAFPTALKDSSPQVRAAAVDAITVVGYVLPVEQARKLLSDSSPKVVERALDGLQCNLLNAHDIVPLLESLARSKGGSTVSSAAIVAAGRCQVMAVCDTLVDTLFALSPDEADAPQARSLVTAIGQCCGRAGREPLEEFISARVSPVEMRRVAVSNIQSAREAAVGILSEIGTAASLPALTAALSDPYYRVRLAALRATDKLGLTCSLRLDITRMVSQDETSAVREEATMQLARARCPNNPQSQ